MDFKKRFAAIINQVLKENNWTHKELAEKLKTSAPQITRYSQGKIFPGPAILIRLSDLINKPVDWILMGEESEKIANVAESTESYDTEKEIGLDEYMQIMDNAEKMIEEAKEGFAAMQRKIKEARKAYLKEKASSKKRKKHK